VRPSIIDDEGARTEFRFGERLALPLARAVFSVLGSANRFAPIRADDIAKALVHLALIQEKPSVRIVESDELQRIAASC
jgi:hypothetical protein